MAWGWVAVAAATAVSAASQQDSARKSRHAAADTIRDQTAAEKAARDQITNSANGRIALAASRKRAQQGLLSLGVDQTTLGPGGQQSGRSLLTAGNYYSTQAAAGSPGAAGANVPGAFYNPAPTTRRPTTPTGTTRI